MTVVNIEKANGELPASRQAAVEQGLVFYQETAAERDRLADEVASLKTSIAAYKVAIEAMEIQLTEARSMATTAGLVRDQAVADRAKWETLFAALSATLRTFVPPAAAPLVKAADETENAAKPEDVSEGA